MRAYLQRAQEHDEFMKEQTQEYQIGKRHLANMMGENPETFTQEDVNVIMHLKSLCKMFLCCYVLERHRVFVSLWFVWEKSQTLDETTRGGVSTKESSWIWWNWKTTPFPVLHRKAQLLSNTLCTFFIQFRYFV